MTTWDVSQIVGITGCRQDDHLGCFTDCPQDVGRMTTWDVSQTVLASQDVGGMTTWDVSQTVLASQDVGRMIIWDVSNWLDVTACRQDDTWNVSQTGLM